MSEISVGKKAPSFTATNTLGEKVKLVELVGKNGLYYISIQKIAHPVAQQRLVILEIILMS
jgi:hypothetical protein